MEFEDRVRVGADRQDAAARAQRGRDEEQLAVRRRDFEEVATLGRDARDHLVRRGVPTVPASVRSVFTGRATLNDRHELPEHWVLWRGDGGRMLLLSIDGVLMAMLHVGEAEGGGRRLVASPIVRNPDRTDGAGSGLPVSRIGADLCILGPEDARDEPLADLVADAVARMTRGTGV